MPIFEYQCRNCGKKYSWLVGVGQGSDEPRCPACGQADGTKLVSKFRRLRSEDERLDEAADRLAWSGEPESGTDARELAKELGRALDDDLSEEMEELFESEQEGSEA